MKPDWFIRSEFPNGRIISTVLLLVHHPGGQYETMVFPSKDNFSELACRRAETKAQAVEDHIAMMYQWGGVQ